MLFINLASTVSEIRWASASHSSATQGAALISVSQSLSRQ